MAEKTIEQRVKDIIVEQLGVQADQVTPKPSSSKILAPTRLIPSSWSWLLRKSLGTRSRTSRPKSSRVLAT